MRRGYCAVNAAVHEVISPKVAKYAGDISLTPTHILQLLDTHIIGQDEAKRTVAVAYRNRWRRMQMPEDFRNEVTPKNILMTGGTGVGKSEIARRLSKIAGIPFVRVEATKYTEAGYVGGNVESIIHDLCTNAKNMCVQKRQEAAKAEVEEKIRAYFTEFYDVDEKAFADGLYDHIEVKESESIRQYFGLMYQPAPGSTFGDIRKQLVSIYVGKESRIPNTEIIESAETGIVFIDEIDKIARQKNVQQASNVSDEGVQKDLLPLIEGTFVNVPKIGTVHTDHILFIGAGSFTNVKVTDLLEELQGRLPLRVALHTLDAKQLYRILTEPAYNLLKQQVQLFATEGVTLVFEDDAIREMADIAVELNTKHENLGARRLHMVVEKVVEQYSFAIPDVSKEDVTITAAIVRKETSELMKTGDISKYIL